MTTACVITRLPKGSGARLPIAVVALREDAHTLCDKLNQTSSYDEYDFTEIELFDHVPTIYRRYTLYYSTDKHGQEKVRESVDVRLFGPPELRVSSVLDTSHFWSNYPVLRVVGPDREGVYTAARDAYPAMRAAHDREKAEEHLKRVGRDAVSNDKRERYDALVAAVQSGVTPDRIIDQLAVWAKEARGQ